MAPHRVDDPTLPPPWQALYDPSSSLKYYWNPNSGETTYTRPGDVGPKAELNNVLAETARIGNGKWERPGEQDAFANGHKSSGPMTCEEYRRKHDLEVIGDFVPEPYQTFEDSGYTPDILEEIRRAGFTHPTPIQAQAWPVAVNGQDLVAIAKTGSGKTCGFLLPGLMHIKSTRKDPRMGPTILVLAPTRELAMQIKQEADKFGRSAGIRNTCVYGGAPKGPQLADLRSGVSIVIATPGRLNDYLEMRQVNLTQVSYLVLDEADRMLDMGFEPQIQKILRTIPPTRQTLFFSATWPKEVKSIAAQFVTNRTVHIFIGGVEEKLVANKSITQHTLMLEGNQKAQELHKILRSKPPGTRIIIFANTKRMCDNLARDIDREFRAAAIHGDKKQSERDYMLSSFKSGRTPILVATDVAARGLDIPHVSAVVNYDFPPGVEDYIHRIGRTGRAGATGDSYTFFTSSDSKYARELSQVLRDAGQMVPPQLEQMSMYGGGGGGRNRWGNSRGYGGGGGGGGRGYGGGGGGHGGGGFGGNSNFTPIGGGPSSAGAGHAPYSMNIAPRGGDRGRDFGRDNFRERRRSRSRSRDRSYRRSRSRSPRRRSKSPDYKRYSPRR